MREFTKYLKCEMLKDIEVIEQYQKGIKTENLYDGKNLYYRLCTPYAYYSDKWFKFRQQSRTEAQRKACATVSKVLCRLRDFEKKNNKMLKENF